MIKYIAIAMIVLSQLVSCARAVSQGDVPRSPALGTYRTLTREMVFVAASSNTLTATVAAGGTTALWANDGSGWHHYADADGTQYIDGATGAWSNAYYSDSEGTLTIGYNGSAYYDGMLSDMRRYTRTLPAAEIQTLATNYGVADDLYPNKRPVKAVVPDLTSDLIDSSGNGNDGTIVGMDYVVDEGEWAGSFDGVGDYVEIPDTVWVSGNGSRTYSAWALFDNLSSSQYIFVNGTAFNGQQFVAGYFSTDNAIEYVWGGHRYGTTALPTTGEWHLYTFIIPDGATQTDDSLLYIDGVLEPLSTLSGSPQTLNTVVGGLNSTISSAVAPFDGKISDVIISPTALSADDVATLHAAGRGADPATVLGITPVASYDFTPANTNTLAISLTGPLTTYTNGATMAEVQDVSGNDNNGTFEPSIETGPQWVGDRGGAYDFDGADNYIIAQESSSLNITGDITLCAWINTRTYISGGAYVITKRDGTQQQYGLIVGASSISLYTWGANAYISTSVVPALNTWVHIVAILSSSGVGEVYVNGIASSTDNTATPITTATSCVYIGARGDGAGGAAYKFDGFIDDPRIYDSALTSNQVYNLYQGIDPTNAPVLHMPFDSPSYLINDISGNNNHATKHNGVKVGGWMQSR